MKCPLSYNGSIKKAGEFGLYLFAIPSAKQNIDGGCPSSSMPSSGANRAKRQSSCLSTCEQKCIWSWHIWFVPLDSVALHIIVFLGACSKFTKKNSKMFTRLSFFQTLAQFHGIKKIWTVKCFFRHFYSSFPLKKKLPRSQKSAYKER